jgi:hypothetical protein
VLFKLEKAAAADELHRAVFTLSMIRFIRLNAWIYAPHSRGRSNEDEMAEEDELRSPFLFFLGRTRRRSNEG